MVSQRSDAMDLESKRNKPKILKSEKLCYLLIQLLIECREDFKILDKNIYSLCSIMPVWNIEKRKKSVQFYNSPNNGTKFENPAPRSNEV
jgi:hypothetical protein